MSISPVRYNESVPAGSTIVFNVSLSPDNTNEVAIETVSITGDCSSWLTVEPSAPIALPAQFKVTANIPGDATNGPHRCDLGYTLPAKGMMQVTIGFPLTFNVTGGIEPTPTLITTSAPTIAVITTTSVSTTRTIVPTRTTYVSLPVWVSLAALGVIPFLRRR